MMTRTLTPTTGGWTRWRLLATLGAATATASTPEIATVVGPAMTVPAATTVWNSERWNGPLVARPSEFLEVVRGSWRYGLGSVRGPLTTAAPTWTKTPDQILNRINRKRSNTTSH
jgi:hypothetical protein